jgi:hypothetical protein
MQISCEFTGFLKVKAVSLLEDKGVSPSLVIEFVSTCYGDFFQKSSGYFQLCLGFTCASIAVCCPESWGMLEPWVTEGALERVM